jgi:hypothetical protein
MKNATPYKDKNENDEKKNKIAHLTGIGQWRDGAEWRSRRITVCGGYIKSIGIIDLLGVGGCSSFREKAEGKK